MKFDIQKFFFLSTLLSMLVLPACVDLDYEEPPVSGTPLTVDANTTIADLKDLYIPGKPTEIEGEVIIRGVVTANDRSGNLYRTFYLQDSTAGIEVQIALTNSYNFYIEGRELAINCEGLVLGEYNGVIYLGGYIYEEGGGQEVGLIVDYNQRIYRGELLGVPEPKVRTINQLTTADIGSLIKLENVEFEFGEIGLTYSDPIGRQTINRTLVDCNGNELVVRSSGYADFAGDTLAAGNGSIVAIYSVFRDDKQLFIRDTEDLMFNGTRCNGSSGEITLMTIADLREAYAGGAVDGPVDKKIRGVVISDGASGNIDGRNVVIQDATGGITVRFQDFHNFALNEEIEVIVSGQELSEFNDLLQVSFISNNLASSLGSGTSPTPRVATVNDVLENLEAWESTLVEIKNATLSGSSTFSGAVTVSDGSGSIEMFTRFGANFADAALPTEPVDLIAIVSQFEDPQLVMRNISDVDGEIGGGGDPVEMDIMAVREMYEGGASAAPAERKIRGVVISDRDNGNITGRNLVIQDATGGLVVRFDDEHNFSYGEEIEVVISGEELSEFNGLFQVNEVPLSNASSFGNGSLPTPRTATIQEIINNLEDWESTVVEIIDVTFPQGGTFQGDNGTQILEDASGQLPIYTRSQASFVNESVPGGPVTITAIVSQFNDAQVNIRNLNDIEQ
jgi:hypothetical protein